MDTKFTAFLASIVLYFVVFANLFNQTNEIMAWILAILLGIIFPLVWYKHIHASNLLLLLPTGFGLIFGLLAIAMTAILRNIVNTTMAKANESSSTNNAVTESTQTSSDFNTIKILFITQTLLLIGLLLSILTFSEIGFIPTALHAIHSKFNGIVGLGMMSTSVSMFLLFSVAFLVSFFMLVHVYISHGTTNYTVNPVLSSISPSPVLQYVLYFLLSILASPILFTILDLLVPIAQSTYYIKIGMGIISLLLMVSISAAQISAPLTLAMLLSAIIGWFIAIYGHVDIVSKLYQMRAPAVSLITIIGPFAILGVGLTEFVLAYQLAAVSRSQRVV